MADWKKVLFEGADINATSITASSVPTTASTATDLPVLVVDGDGKFKTVNQANLQSSQGETTGSISGSDGTSFDDFNFSSHTLNITTGNTNIFVASASISSSTQTVVTFKPVHEHLGGNSGYITSSGQLNIISGTAIPDAANLGSDWLTAIYNPFIVTSTLNTFTVDNQEQQVTESLAYQNFTNLWANPQTDQGGDANTPSTSATELGKKSYFWLSSSYVGGFNDGTPSLSASFSTFTGSVETISESIGGFINSASRLNEHSSSFALSSTTSSLALLSELTSKEVNSIEEGNIQVEQITFLDTNEAGATLDQGKRLRLGTPTTDTAIQGIDSNAHDLTIGDSTGIFTANDYGLTLGLSIQQVNVQRINGGIIFGTSSLHNHSFLGNTFVTGGIVNINGPVTFDDPLTVENSFVNVLVVKSDGKTLAKSSVGTSANNALLSSIASSSNGVSQSFADRINVIRDLTTTDAGTDTTNIGILTQSYDIITGSYHDGIFFSTASSISAFNAGTIDGFSTPLRTTASFTASQIEGDNPGHDVILTSSADTNGNVTYTFNTASFVQATGIFTSSGAITSSVAALARYGSSSQLILTQSNTAANIEYIANLATDLTSNSSDRFLTSSAGGAISGDFNQLVNTPVTSLVDDVTSTTQGVLDFTLNSTYKFGGTASKMHTGGSPQFTGLTVNSGLKVEGTFTTINKQQLNVKDQFILINSGALTGGGAASDNDKDGGIIVGGGGGSGSLIMYDYSAKAWGVRGATDTNQVEDDAKSSGAPGTAVVPDVYIRGIISDAGHPPISSASLYGVDAVKTNRGLMYIDTTPNTENVYIYA